MLPDAVPHCSAQRSPRPAIIGACWLRGCPGRGAASPFPAENLGLYCMANISTRYRDRETSVQAVSDALARLTSGKTGNYLAFFQATPISGRYMKILQRVTRHPHACAGERRRRCCPGRISCTICAAPKETLLGFGVLGGVFGEGVDLAGDRLIGCAIVGVGLPQVNPQQEMLRGYYDAQNGSDSTMPTAIPA